MKKSIIAILLAVSLVTTAATSNPAEARERSAKRISSTNEHPVQTQMSAPSHSEGGHAGGMTFGLGVSTIEPVSGGNGSLTGILAFTQHDALQLLVSIPGTNGGFRFGAGALYKRTVAGNQGAGFHLGGGFGMGRVLVAGSGEFEMNILGNLGVHYAPAGSDIVFHLDGGPVFFLQTGAAGSTTSFGIGQYASVLGASVVYMF